MACRFAARRYVSETKLLILAFLGGHALIGFCFCSVLLSERMTIVLGVAFPPAVATNRNDAAYDSDTTTARSKYLGKVPGRMRSLTIDCRRGTRTARNSAPSGGPQHKCFSPPCKPPTEYPTWDTQLRRPSCHDQSRKANYIDR